MKKPLGIRRMATVLVIATQFAFLSAQTGENPKPNTNTRPQGGSQSSNPRPVTMPRPIIMPRPIMIPGPIYNSNTQPPANMQAVPPKTAEEIAAEKRAMAFDQVRKEMFQLTPDVQSIEIKDVSKPFHVKGSKGFELHFPEFAFIDQDGNTVLGDVSIKLTEYTSYSEFAAAGLTTMTTDGEILETAGMINVEALSGDQKLKLAQGKEIKITVPDADPSKGFRTFYGSGTDQIKWSTNPAQANMQTDTLPFDGYTIKMLKPTAYAYGDHVTMAFYKNSEPVEEYVNKQLKVSKDIKNKILKAGIPFVYTIEFNALGKIKEVTPKNAAMTEKSLIAPLNSQIVALLKNAPAFAMSEGNLVFGKPYDIIFATAKNYTGTKVVPAPPLEFPQKNNAISVNQAPTEKNVNEFTMNSTSLTKINCDRFSGYSSTDTAFFHFDRADALVYIVLKDMRSMISPTGANGSYSMTKIPANTAVRYVAVVYDDNGGVHIASKDTVFKQGEVTFDNNIPFNSQNLKSALEGE